MNATSARVWRTDPVGASETTLDGMITSLVFGARNERPVASEPRDPPPARRARVSVRLFGQSGSRGPSADLLRVFARRDLPRSVRSDRATEPCSRAVPIGTWLGATSAKIASRAGRPDYAPHVKSELTATLVKPLGRVIASGHP